jgi:histidinol-phosphate phosphatase family protein
MKSLRVHVVLVAVILAVLGALLHPLSLILGFAPFDIRGLMAALVEVRATIANLLGWGFLSLLIVMVGYVAWGRLFETKRHSALSQWLPDDSDSSTTAPMSPGVVVAVTAYNDAEATAQAVKDFLRQPRVIDVIVIDNNSTDQTEELAIAAGGRVIRETRQGYGYACMRGLSEGLNTPGADVIALTEGDGTFVADDLAKFLAYMDHADMVVGNRVVRGLVDSGSQMDYFFTWGNIAVALLVRLRFWDWRFLGPAGLTDVGCTFRAIRRPALARILPELSVGGNHFSPHMILVAVARGLSVIEIPIRFRRRRGKSKGASQSFVKGLNVGLAMVWHILTFSPRPSLRRRGVFVERDGVIVRYRQSDADSRPRIEFLPGALEGLAALSHEGRRVLVIGDESTGGSAGIPRQIMSAVHGRIADEVGRRGGHIDAFIMCSHDSGSVCSCREPEPGLLLRAKREFDIDLMTSLMLSNRERDLEAAARLGCGTVLVGGDNSGTLPDGSQLPNAVDFADAVQMVFTEPDRARAVAPSVVAQDELAELQPVR